MPSDKRQFGDSGEEKAVQFLKRQGYQILERNFRSKGGEIDIVAARSGFFKTKKLVFVEVKTIKDRGKISAALAAQNVHYQKRQRLIKTVEQYLATKKIKPEIPWSIDVIIVVAQPGGGAAIEHLENAVW